MGVFLKFLWVICCVTSSSCIPPEDLGVSRPDIQVGGAVATKIPETSNIFEFPLKVSDNSRFRIQRRLCVFLSVCVSIRLSVCLSVSVSEQYLG